MKKSLCGVLVCLVLCLPLSLKAESKESVKLRDATEVLSQIMAIQEQAIPPTLLANARGIAVLPGVIKAGFFVGGRYGKGVMTVLTAEGVWSMPVFITITGGSFGWQVGAQSTDIILVFKSRKGIDAIRSGKFTLGADAAIAAGPVGRQAGAATDVEMKAEIYSYSRTRGLFAGIALEGAALQLDYDANNAFYGAEVNTDEFFKGKAPKTPEAAKQFVAEVQKAVSLKP